jgi:hypothetical protein
VMFFDTKNPLSIGLVVVFLIGGVLYLIPLIT